MKKLSLFLLTALLLGGCAGPTFLTDSPKKDTSHFQFKKRPTLLNSLTTSKRCNP